jgi:hypothetical protein
LRLVDSYVFNVIAAIIATDATPFLEFLRAWCRSLE